MNLKLNSVYLISILENLDDSIIEKMKLISKRYEMFITNYQNKKDKCKKDKIYNCLQEIIDNKEDYYFDIIINEELEFQKLKNIQNLSNIIGITITCEIDITSITNKLVNLRRIKCKAGCKIGSLGDMKNLTTYIVYDFNCFNETHSYNVLESVIELPKVINTKKVLIFNDCIADRKVKKIIDTCFKDWIICIKINDIFFDFYNDYFTDNNQYIFLFQQNKEVLISGQFFNKDEFKHIYQRYLPLLNIENCSNKTKFPNNILYLSINCNFIGNCCHLTSLHSLTLIIGDKYNTIDLSKCKVLYRILLNQKNGLTTFILPKSIEFIYLFNIKTYLYIKKPYKLKDFQSFNSINQDHLLF